MGGKGKKRREQRGEGWKSHRRIGRGEGDDGLGEQRRWRKRVRKEDEEDKKERTEGGTKRRKREEEEEKKEEE